MPKDWLKGADDYYDIVVVGSGLGGLTGANSLAKLGYSVLLLEHHYQFGGLATWFKRAGGHIFDISLHGFPIGMIKSCRKYWTKEIADSIIQLKNIRFMNPQYDLRTTFDRWDFTRILQDKFKVAKGKVEAFFEHLRTMNYFDLDGRTTAELFEEFFPGRDDVKRLLMEPIAYANGSTLDDPAITYGIVFSNFMNKGVFTFRGGTDVLIKKMVVEMKKNGVDLRRKCLVKKVITDERDGKSIHGLRAIDDTTFGFFPGGAEEPSVTFPYRGYVSPTVGSPFLSDERQFNLMFRTSLGPVDPIQEIVDALDGKELSKDETRKLIDEKIGKSAVYLRPETAQAMFVQFSNIQQAMSAKIPFGIAQMGKSFRNEVTVEHFIFRSCEFEQMELEYFVEPGKQKEALEFWKNERLDWYLKYANDKSKFRLRQHEGSELAHYADDCWDIEYAYPWGWGELEGIASRTDYDLKKHSEASGQRLTYFDPEKENPETGKKGVHYTPYVVEPAAGATRATLMYLLDAFAHEKSPKPDAKGNIKMRRVLKLHPRLSPYKVAVLPLVKRDGMPELAREIVSQFFAEGINAKYDAQHQIGKRYARHDEVGTPYCLTIDGDSTANGTVTIRDRDTTEQETIKIDEALGIVRNRLAGS